MLQSWVHRPRPSQDSQTSPRTPSAPPIAHKRSWSAALPSDLTSRVGRAISSSSLNLSSSPTNNVSATPSPTKMNQATPGHSASASVPYLGPNGGPNGGSYYNDDDSSMSTIPDPRSRALSPTSTPSSPAHTPHPDLSDEVASLSNKLINAINHQTNLDDTLNVTRQQLSASQDRVKELELEAVTSRDSRDEMEELIRTGSLVWEADVAKERKKLVAEAAEEMKKRVAAEKERANIESELENLTTALFEEANKMVKTAREEARRDHQEMQKKNDQLAAKLRDTEALLKLHQEQLAGLKNVMEKMDEELVELNARQSEEMSRRSQESSTRQSREIRTGDGAADEEFLDCKKEIDEKLHEAPAVRNARRSVEMARQSLEHVVLEHKAEKQENEGVPASANSNNANLAEAEMAMERAEMRLSVAEDNDMEQRRASAAADKAQTMAAQAPKMQMHL